MKRFVIGIPLRRRCVVRNLVFRSPALRERKRSGEAWPLQAAPGALPAWDCTAWLAHGDLSGCSPPEPGLARLGAHRRKWLPVRALGLSALPGQPAEIRPAADGHDRRFDGGNPRHQARHAELRTVDGELRVRREERALTKPGLRPSRPGQMCSPSVNLKTPLSDLSPHVDKKA